MQTCPRQSRRLCDVVGVHTGSGIAPEIAREFRAVFTTKVSGRHGLVCRPCTHHPPERWAHLALERTWPRHDVRITYRAPSAASPRPSGCGRMPEGTDHILLVEDDPSVRRLSKNCSAAGLFGDGCVIRRSGWRRSTTPATSISPSRRHPGRHERPGGRRSTACTPALDSRTLYVGLYG